MYVGTSSGVYKSEDSGSSWLQSSSFNVNCIKINPTLTNEIFAAGEGGVYFSNDGSSTWQEFNSGLICTNVACLDMNVQNKILYAGSYTGSAYKNNLLNLYALIINAGTGGTTDPSPGTYTYDSGTEVTITAIPDTGSRFSGWTGGVPQGHENDNPITITMDWDKSITANFVWDCTLTIASGNNGTTDPAPGTHTYDSGTEVTITAIPDTDYGFSHWSGDAPQGHENDNPLIITIDSDISITANFIGQYTLTVASGDNGTTDPAPGSYPYNSGTEVTIEAKPDSGYNFSNWSGDASGTTNPITITMDSDKSITANFSAITTGDGDDTGKKGGCFIATEVYGSSLHPNVMILRDFRDIYLMPSKSGRALVNLYYKYSPFVAELITKHKTLKAAVKINLLPLVAFSYSMLHFGPLITVVMLVFVFVLPVFLILFLRRKQLRLSINC